jgi:cytosine/adenosine deaminase-related metal-dependent hydrolase
VTVGSPATSERLVVRADVVLPDAWSDAIGDGAVLVEAGRIVSVGAFSALHRSYPLARVLERRPALLVPGLIDAHSHGRSYPPAHQDYGGGGPLERFLAEITAWTPVDPGDDARVAAHDLVATGVTTVQAMFHSFADRKRYRRDAEAFAGGLAASGASVVLALGVTDRDEFVPPGAAVADLPAQLAAPERGLAPGAFVDLLDELLTDPSGALAGTDVAIGPVAPQWCSPALWRSLAQRPLRVHTHLLESRAQRRLAPDAVSILDAAGVLDDRLSAAHGVWLSPAEQELLAARSATLVHCPSSNDLLAVGEAPVRAWLDAGLPVALGLDSNASTTPPDAFAELRRARAVARRAGAALTARDAFAMATLGGAAAVGRGGDIGAVAPGAAADLVGLDLVVEGQADPVEALCADATRSDVAVVLAGGRVAHERGRLDPEVEQARGRVRRTLEADRADRARRLAALRSHLPALLALWGEATGSAARETERGEHAYL